MTTDAFRCFLHFFSLLFTFLRFNFCIYNSLSIPVFTILRQSQHWSPPPTMISIHSMAKITFFSNCCKNESFFHNDFVNSFNSDKVLVSYLNPLPSNMLLKRHCGKRKFTGNQHFLLFPLCFLPYHRSSFSHNVFYPITEKLHHLSDIEIVVCK